MGIAGSISPSGGAPKPDPARVAAIRYTIVDEAETCAAFGEAARTTLASLNDRALAETRSGDLGECALLLDHVRDRVAGLDPARLQPRTGLAGLFDSRAKRLKAFRTAYASAASAVTHSATDIGDRAGALSRKGIALETLWSETRDAITELDAHIAAARGWLANEAPAPIAEHELPVATAPEPEIPAQGEADDEAHPPTDTQTVTEGGDAGLIPVIEDAPREPTVPSEPSVSPSSVTETIAESASIAEADPVEPVEHPRVRVDAVTDPAPRRPPEPEPTSAGPEPAVDLAPVATLPHPLETRLAALESVRAVGIGRLPLLRAAQNADLQAPATLKQVCDGIEAWRADWHNALGLVGRKSKRMRPDQVRLTGATSALTDRIDVAGRELSAAQGRRAELDARANPLQAPARIAA